MRSIVYAAVLSCVPFAVFAQTPAADQAAVRKVITDHYFKAHSTGSGEPLKGTFIDEGRMMWVQEGQLRVRPSAEYIAGFPGKPAADEAKRSRRVVMVDVTADMAVAKVELDHPDMLITDYFSLLRFGGDWKIVHKTFSRAPKKSP